MLRQLVANTREERIDLRNRITVEIHTASYTSTRGYTIVAALLDELAFWPSDEQSAQPDVEVLNAIKPGMATIPTRCCCVPPVLTLAVVRSGTRIIVTRVRTVILFWSGVRLRGR
jgi:hypothetical protein